MERTKKGTTLSEQMKRKVNRKEEPFKEYEGDLAFITSTGSTLVDLAISGSRIRGGGLPGGILVEIFGPSGTGKTVFLSQIAGNIQKAGGETKFHDPEARLNPQFAKMFGLELKEGDYTRPDTVPEVFSTIHSWKPPKGVINGVLADSLAALSTNMEMEDGDKMGMRRAKEFSEELRKACRVLAKNNLLMVCSNQVRVNAGATWGPKYTTPGGEAIGFYSSVRLSTSLVKKLTKEKTFRGKKEVRKIGIQIEVEVAKNSVDKPFRTAPVTIIFDYGIDDIRENLQYIKKYSGKKTYTLGERNLGVSMEEAITKIESENLEKALKKEVIELWTRIESQFKSDRKPRI